MSGFDDFLPMDDFIIDPEDVERDVSEDQAWNTGVPSDIFATGENQDLWSTVR